MITAIIRFFFNHPLVVGLLLLLGLLAGLSYSPFEFNLPGFPRDPVPVDAIPDIGDNQQIVYTEWPGRSPREVENQITYPLTTALLGLPGVRTVRSNSMFGFSSIYIIFEDRVDFYWSRSRILEKLNALPPQLLPTGVQPSLGPDATGLGQIFWYTLEGRDPQGHPTGGWDPHELRSIQDYTVRYALAATPGVAEVAAVGGMVKEYQIDLDPDKLRTWNISLEEVLEAVRGSNLDAGAQTIEINRVEYFVRGLGYLKSLSDIENTVVRVSNNIPIRISDIGRVNLGPAERRGMLDKGGSAAVGGVVVARFGSNPLAVIQGLREKIAEIQPGLPRKTLPDGTLSQVQLVPFYDRSTLIRETIATLSNSLAQEILVTVVVVLALLFNLRAALVVSGLLPLAVLFSFIAMKWTGVDANVVALAGIAIAIGTMVDVGIVMAEAIVYRLEHRPPEEPLRTSILEACSSVGGAITAAVVTTIVSFLPVFGLEGPEGKLFHPLAYTKTYALAAAVLLSLLALPNLAVLAFSWPKLRGLQRLLANLLLGGGGVGIWIGGWNALGGSLLLIALANLIQVGLERWARPAVAARWSWLVNAAYAGVLIHAITRLWMPLGLAQGLVVNLLVVGSLIIGILGLLFGITKIYAPVLRWILAHPLLFLALPLGVVAAGVVVFRQMGREFMPALDEGAFLLMPTALPHAGTQEINRNLRLLDLAVSSIPEVEVVVGKAGRAESALDPAPLSMFENYIGYRSEYRTDSMGRRLRFRIDRAGQYVRDPQGNLIPDPNGRFFRQWRDHIRSPDDIWQEVARVTALPGLTGAPRLQPIETRLVMLQTGMRAPIGIKVRGPDLATIESFGFALEKILRTVDGVKASAVFADRVVGKPYLLLTLRREALARHGLSVEAVQRHLEAAIGGVALTQTVEGRERYQVRVRYPREWRNDPAVAAKVLIPSRSNGAPIPLSELVETSYETGPPMIKSEDGFLVGYVLLDKAPGFAEVTTVENAQRAIAAAISAGELSVPAGVSYRFAGNYENQVRANQRLAIILPVTLVLILLIQYLEFRSLTLSLMVFSGVIVAFAGGFIFLWLYGQPWFLNVPFLGQNLRDIFQFHPVNLSVAVWIGFLALFGIVTDDGVLMATHLRERFAGFQPTSVDQIRAEVVAGAMRRIRPAMMITATTLLGFLPVLTATGRGADLMAPMAIPAFGGLLIEILSIFIVPTLFCLWQEWRWWRQKKQP